ncbi:hypothetical protein [Streptosporangium carneum]|uniref:Uncharacterized protein n=1 Tax=Streptosporangium carneum TaxID=47481 RepID=A0A9W6I554_9ACTN|nr:hypothetical protein [Streptosporangium carneum]GLK11883.1 hypothetical protein GCM10017600_52910 [Streptosporangium carneum]
MTVAADGALPARGRAPASVRTATVSRGWIPAFLVLLGAAFSLTAASWDIQWHIDVGPDTFFTLPHLVLYAGSALSGLASLAVVLMTTAARRADREVDTTIGGRAVPVLGGTFAAPLGYLVSGAGSAGFLLYGLFDLWWHSLYGFDAVIASPPHIGLILSIALSMVGAVMVFAAAWAHRWARLGVILAFTVTLAFSLVATQGLAEIDGGVVDPVSVGVTFLTVLVVFMAVGFLRDIRLVLGFGIVFAAAQALLWWFSPWATRAYAVAVGLPMRDYVSPVPLVPAEMPMSLPAVAALTWWAVSSVGRDRPGRLVASLVGGLAGLVVTVCGLTQASLVYRSTLPTIGEMPPTVVAGVLVGALAGFLGRRFSAMLRAVVPATPREASAASQQASAPSQEGR